MMLLYTTFGSNNLVRSKSFYDATLVPLGLSCSVNSLEELGYGPTDPKPGERTRSFYIVKPCCRSLQLGATARQLPTLRCPA